LIKLPGAFHHRGFFLSHVKRIRELYASDGILYQTIPKMAGRLFHLEVTPAGLHFIAWLRRRGRFPVIHACSRANRHLAPPSFFLLHQGSVGSRHSSLDLRPGRKRKLNKVWQNWQSAVKQVKQRGGGGNGSSFQTPPLSPATSSYWPSTS